MTRRSIVALVLGVGAMSLLACDADSKREDAPTPEAFLLLDPTWEHCANQGEFCGFDGTQSVRYVRDGRVLKTIEASDGVACSNATFGVWFVRGAHCELLVVHEEPDPEEPDPEEPDPEEPDAGHHPTEPPPSDAGGGTMGGGTMGGGTMGGGTMGGGGMGPYINVNAIPAGDPGLSTREVSYTGEFPDPDSDIGAFRTSCLYSRMSFDDPIVYPGRPGAAHLHTFFGNTGTNAYSTPSSLRSSGNSTCRGGIANRTAYWVPSVIDPNGTPLKPSSAEFYYKTGYNGIRPAQVQPFPQGLRMIAGSASSTGPGQEHVYWACHENDIGHVSAIPSCLVGDHVLMVVVFPQCWDGRNLDSSDHKSHMAYPVDDACPSTHPVPIPEISFNVLYPISAGSDSGRWRLSSDMYPSSQPGGYSLHGDYFEGWERELVDTFIRLCDQASMDCHSHLLGDGRAIFNPHEEE